jgi:hypothetical protein
VKKARIVSYSLLREVLKADSFCPGEPSGGENESGHSFVAGVTEVVPLFLQGCLNKQKHRQESSLGEE